MAAVGVGLAGWLVVGGPAGVAAGVLAGLAALGVLDSAGSSAARRERAAIERELPQLIDLYASTLRAGADPRAGLARVCAALPGPAATRLAVVTERARWGADAAGAWSDLLDDDALAPLARTMVRAEATGASVVQAVERLAEELRRESLAHAEDAARRVGVAAAIPLGVCLLPAFLLLGVVPTVASLLESIAP